MSQIFSGGRKNKINRRWLAHGRRGAVALEFAILAIPFFMWILFIFELSYDLFVQEALDYTVHAAVRQIQTGTAASLTSGASFITTDVCNASKGLLECSNLWLRVTAVPAGSDFSPPTTSGAVPLSGGSLDLTNYTNSQGANTGKGSTATPYCIAGPSQPILISALYLGPSFIGGLLPGMISISYQGNLVHPTLSTAGFITEAFPGNPNPPGGGTGSGSGNSTQTAPAC